MGFCILNIFFFLGVNDRTVELIFGLGENTFVDHLIVEWPSGIVDEIFNIAANQEITIQEGSSQGCSELGDLNDDGTYNVLDIVLVVNIILG